MNNKELLNEETIIKTLLEKAHAEESFHEFVRQAWPAIEGETPFSDGWHINAICDHLEAAVSRDIKNLLIHVPPRTCKSTIISVMFPAWVWVNNPSESFLYASYASSLSLEHSVKCRRLVASTWYQQRWGNLFKLVGDQNTKSKFENDKKGMRTATSVGGSITGIGANILVCDDPNNAKDGESEVKREATNSWFSQVWSTRINDPKNYARIVVQQRLHESDVSGYILKSESSTDWVKLILPMEFEKGKRSKTIHLPYMKKDEVWGDPRSKEGELLWPERMGRKYIEERKRELGTYGYAGQYQQRPSPTGGGIIKKDWFKIWKKENPPKLDMVIQSWDTALEVSDKNAYSACTTWGIFQDDNGYQNIILLSLWRGKVEYSELRKIAKRLYNDYRDDGERDITPDAKHISDMVLVEAKVSGFSLIQDLTRSGIPVTRFNPSRFGDKMQRVQLISPSIERGQVWVPALPPDYRKLRKISQELLDNCASFPNADSRDLVDTMTQVLLRLRTSGMLEYDDDTPIKMKKSEIKGNLY